MARSSKFRLGSNEDLSNSIQCGFSFFSPRWLQPYATPKFYLALYCILGIIQGAYYTYIVGVITTLEKRFSFSSKISGLLLVSDAISITFLSPIVGYYGRKFHRPRMMAFGMCFVVVSCFLCTLPYFIYGPGDLKSYLDKDNGHQICDPDRTSGEVCEQSHLVSSSYSAITLLFFSIFLNGVGNCAFYTIGTAYLDDNIKKKDSPLYFSILMALRIFGPAMGFVVSSICLQYPEDMSTDPGITPEDPRWIGAWWLGFVFIGIFLMLFSIPFSFFPRVLPSCPTLKSQTEGFNDSSAVPKLADIIPATKKLIQNKIYITILVSGMLQIIGWGGFYTFLPKYIETYFHISAHRANLYTGVTGPVSLLLGTVLGGYMVRRFQPKPRMLTGCMMFVDQVAQFMFIAFLFMRCPHVTIDKPGYELQNECNAPCHCTPGTFDPVCHQETRTNYITPCYAGCLDILNDTTFSNCGCGPENDPITSGFCIEDCNMFLPFIILLSFGKFISSTCRVGSTLIVLRCVEPEEKDFSLGISSALFNIFAFIPYPIIYGAFTDSACTLWEEKCGETGNCWLYDGDKFRYYLHGATAAFILAGNIVQLALWYFSKEMKDLYSDSNMFGSIRRESDRRLSTLVKTIS